MGVPLSTTSTNPLPPPPSPPPQQQPQTLTLTSLPPEILLAILSLTLPYSSPPPPPSTPTSLPSQPTPTPTPTPSIWHGWTATRPTQRPPHSRLVRAAKLRSSTAAAAHAAPNTRRSAAVLRTCRAFYALGTPLLYGAGNVFALWVAKRPGPWMYRNCVGGNEPGPADLAGGWVRSDGGGGGGGGGHREGGGVGDVETARVLLVRECLSAASDVALACVRYVQVFVDVRQCFGAESADLERIAGDVRGVMGLLGRIDGVRRRCSRGMDGDGDGSGGEEKRLEVLCVVDNLDAILRPWGETWGLTDEEMPVREPGEGILRGAVAELRALVDRDGGVRDGGGAVERA